MKDVRDIDILPDDTVAYTTRHGSKVELIVGKVEDVGPDRVRVITPKRQKAVILKDPRYVITLGFEYLDAAPL